MTPDHCPMLRPRQKPSRSVRYLRQLLREASMHITFSESADRVMRRIQLALDGHVWVAWWTPKERARWERRRARLEKGRRK